jgi:hypothetical protein
MSMLKSRNSSQFIEKNSHDFTKNEHSRAGSTTAFFAALAL